jgi:hypothetical protein
LVKALREQMPPDDEIMTGAAPAEEPEKKKTTQAEHLLQLVDASGASFFRTTENELYSTIPACGHTEIWQLEGRDFKTWLSGLYYRETGRAINNDAVVQVLTVLSAKARFDDPNTIQLSTRVAERDGAFWYDLTNEQWQAVKITSDGWAVSDSPPILFTRYRHQAAQPLPQPGGDVRKIARHINLKDQRTLFLCWLVSCFIPGIPHPMPIFYGEKGAAKSTACGLLKTLIDPSALETLTLQSDPRTMAVNLQQHYFLPFDNVSHINEEMSDTLCRAITGGGIQQRKLFTNADDHIFTFQRCLAINGINNVATRPDLLDRSLLVELERISDTERRELSEIQRAFQEDRPAILGGILDTLSAAMRIYPSVRLDRLYRMADFTRWGYAIGEALGGRGRRFLEEYDANRESQNTEAINSDPVATLIVEFMRGRSAWDGTVAELYRELSAIAADHNISVKSKAFPDAPARLGKRINGIKSNLEAVGVFTERRHTMGGSYLSFGREKLPSLLSYRHNSSNTKALGHDSSMTVNDGKESTVMVTVMPKPLQILGSDSNDSNDGKIVPFTEGLPKGRTVRL